MLSSRRAESPIATKLSLPEFFDRLAQAAVIRASEVPPGSPHQPESTGYRLGVFIGHVKHLKMLTDIPPENRTASVIRASWEVVKEIGLQYGFFQDFQGEPELRRTLVEFLNSGN